MNDPTDVDRITRQCVDVTPAERAGIAHPGIAHQARLGPNPERPTLPAGKLQAIGLEEVRKRLGADWNKRAAQIHVIVEKTIKRRFADTDVFGRMAELGYFVLFSALSAEEVEIECATIAREVAKSLLGEDLGDAAADVKQTATDVDGSLVFENSDPLLGRRANA